MGVVHFSETSSASLCSLLLSAAAANRAAFTDGRFFCRGGIGRGRYEKDTQQAPKVLSRTPKPPCCSPSGSYMAVVAVVKLLPVNSVLKITVRTVTVRRSSQLLFVLWLELEKQNTITTKKTHKHGRLRRPRHIQP